MDERMASLKENLKNRNINNFKVLSYEQFTLKVIAYNDFNNNHKSNVEMVFEGVSFVECPVKFKDAEIRFGTNDERELILNNHKLSYTEDEESLFCFFTKNDSRKYYIFAEEFDFVVKE